jgi:hypothetical protein
MTTNQLQSLSTHALENQKRITRALVDLDGGDIEARAALLAINREIGRREKEERVRFQPIRPRI